MLGVAKHLRRRPALAEEAVQDAFVTRDEIDRLAGEYVIGLLDGADAAAAERLLGRDPAFGAAVARWRTRFSELDDAAPMLPASDALWRRIEAGVEADAATAEPGQA